MEAVAAIKNEDIIAKCASLHEEISKDQTTFFEVAHISDKFERLHGCWIVAGLKYFKNGDKPLFIIHTNPVSNMIVHFESREEAELIKSKIERKQEPFDKDTCIVYQCLDIASWF
ncbi:MAG: hypothetical protein RL154_301 [Pseudomonadota bacterium]